MNKIFKKLTFGILILFIGVIKISAQVVIDDPQVNEDTGTITFTVSSVLAIVGDVDYASSDGTAIAGSDYTSVSGTLTFTGIANESFTINVPITVDTILEPNETFLITLSNPTGTVTISDASGTGTITNDDTASIAINSPVAVTEGSNVVFTVTLAGAVQGGFTVDYATADGSATAGSDYTSDSGQLSFTGTSGETQTITITTTDDSLVEGVETFVTNLSNASVGITISTPQGTGTLNDNDTASIAINSPVAVTEGSNVVFTVTLTGAVQGGFTVDYATADGSATAGSDYTSDSGQLSFTGTSGETQTITITTTDDSLVEGVETFVTNLSNASVGVTISTPQGTGTLNDNDTASIAINSPVAVTEGSNVVFTVTLTGAVQGGFTVDYATADGSATAGSDYTSDSGQLSFTGTSGETQTITITTTDDSLVEGVETFVTNLSNASVGVTISTPQGTGTLNDNDTASIAINSPVAVTEGSNVVFTVTLTGAVQGGFTVDYATADGSATAGSDYTSDSGQLSFTGTSGETQTITITTTDDSLVEGVETFVTNLSNASVGVTISTPQGTGTLNDNDTASIAINSPVAVTEGSNVVFTVTLTGAVQGGFTVDYATADGSATAGSDYTSDSGQLSFTGTSGETQTITITTTDDSLVEGVETFVTNLSNASVGVTISTPQGTGTLNDNDTASIAINSPVAVTEGSNVVFTVTLTGAVQGGFTVDYATADGSATAGSDYTSDSGQLSFTGTSGETQTITITTTDDSLVEGVETFVTNLSNASVGVTISTPQGTGTLNDNDTASIAINSPVAVTEGSNVVFTVTLTGAVQGGFTVDYATADGSATAGSDYTSDSGQLSFTGTSGETQTITITTTDDSLVEGVETFVTNLSNASVGVTISTPQGTGTLNDNDTAGYTVNPTSLTIGENGGQGTFTVVLTAQPETNVVFSISNSNPSEGSISTNTLTFTTANWNAPQPVTVTGIDDNIDRDGDSTTITVSVNDAASDDAFDALANQVVSVTFADDDAADITVTPTNLTIAENGGTDTFSVVLDTQPISDVVFTIQSSDTAEGTVSPSTITFTPSNWNTPQDVTVTGVNDNIDREDDSATITVAVDDAASDDAFDGQSVAVAVVFTDDDDAGINLVPTTLTINENGGSDTFQVSLTSEPLSAVNLTITSSDTNEGTVDVSTMSFNSGNWNIPQTVIVSGVDDSIDRENDTAIITVSVVNATSDDAFDGESEDVTVTFTDDDEASFTVVPTSLTVNENNGTGSFTVVLDTQPVSNVVFLVQSSDTAEGTVSPSTLTFTPSNWDTPQSVTVTGVDDNFVRAGDTTIITIAVVDASSDDEFDSLANQTVTVTFNDNDVAGVTINPLSLTIDENGGSDTFTILLNTEPLNDVVFDIASSNTAEATVLPLSVTFTNANWNTPQTITVTGQDDSIDREGDTAIITVNSNNTLTTDNAYDNITESVTATFTDDDEADITLSRTAFTLNENGGSGTFTVVLDTQPTGNVVVNVSSGSPSEGTVSPSNITFTPSNWNTPQTITVTGVNDNIDRDGDTTIITVSVASAPSGSAFVGISKTVTVTFSDDDGVGLTVDPTLLSVNENGGTGTFNVVLDTEPVNLVVVDVFSNNESEGTVNISSLTFTPSNWNTPQTVTVTGVNDNLDRDGDTAVITVQVNDTETLDNTYDGLQETVEVTFIDDDSAGITVTPTSLTINENGGTGTFTVVLNTQISKNVVLCCINKQCRRYSKP